MEIWIKSRILAEDANSHSCSTDGTVNDANNNLMDIRRDQAEIKPSEKNFAWI